MHVIAASLDALLILNVVLAALVAGAVVSVAVAVALDLAERRRWRVMVPPCWPPPGVDPRDAYADELRRPPTRSGRAPSHGGGKR